MKNILLLFFDQMRFDAIHNSCLQTPHINELIKDGVFFKRAYTPSPVCVPARVSMNYGIYPNTSGCYDNSNCVIEGHKNIFEVLSENGYHTEGIGKMHFSSDKYALHGFTNRQTQEEIFSPGDNDDYRRYLDENGYDYVFDAHGQRSEMYYIPQISQLPAKHHPTQWVGDRSVEFIDKYSSDKPFLLMSSFIHPHPPFSPPTPWNKLYRMGDMPAPFVPDGYLQLLTYYNKKQNRYKCIDDGVNNYTVLTLKAYYYACISFIDYQIRRIIETLKNRGLYDSTLIIFASDHGELLGDYNSYGKRTMLDSACKIPLFLKAPNLMAGKVCDSPASLIDIMPTILTYAGVEYADLALQGEDLISVANGASKRACVFSQLGSNENGLYMIATKDEKYIRSEPDAMDYYFYGTRQEERNQFDELRDKAEKLKNSLLAQYLKKERFLNNEPRKISDDKRTGHIFQDHIGLREREKIIPNGYRVDLR
ncbi:MAG: sulfatase-like hydrolase/transferase [Bacillota bacterium]|nr:sulfatase-like hydrolase/transferase [Bacillota bacterium]